MATFVIVHGAWGGGWAWRQTVAPMLEARGHTVYTPTLTGLGERSHLATPATNLDTHIQDICNVLFWEDLHDVILVGHSYGGMVITGVADRMGERLQRLVYLDAFVPSDGQSLTDMVQAAGGASQGPGPQMLNDWQIAHPEDTTTPPSAERDWLAARHTPQPVQTFRQPFTVTGGQGQDLPRLYVYCTSPASPPFTPIAARLRHDPAWDYVEFPTGHVLYRTMPQETVDLLAAQAAQ